MNRKAAHLEVFPPTFGPVAENPGPPDVAELQFLGSLTTGNIDWAAESLADPTFPIPTIDHTAGCSFLFKSSVSPIAHVFQAGGLVFALSKDGDYFPKLGKISAFDSRQLQITIPVCSTCGTAWISRLFGSVQGSFMYLFKIGGLFFNRTEYFC